MNILVLAAAYAGLDMHDGGYPHCLTEFDGVPLIERLVTNTGVLGDAKYIFALQETDVSRFHLDNVVALLAPGSVALPVSSTTKGAACTALLAAAHIDNDEELLIVSANELVDTDLSTVIARFRASKLDGGTLTFPSIHPRYSYVRLNGDNLVAEAAQRNPISNNATVGIFWYARGQDFVAAAKNMIRKGAQVDGLFYICPAFNELILEQARIGVFPIEARCYHPLKTERQVYLYENLIEHASRS
jgi:hypothetical protein